MVDRHKVAAGTVAYRLRNIPAELWRAVLQRTAIDDTTVRAVLLASLERYAQKELRAARVEQRARAAAKEQR